MGTRPEKLASAIKREISLILIEKMRDPRIGFVTITEVKLSSDLKTAKVFYSVFGSEKNIKNAQYGLNSAAKYIKGLVGEKLPHLRYMPEIVFEYDQRQNNADKIHSLLNQIKNEKSETSS